MSLTILQRLEQIERQLANMVVRGKVIEVDTKRQKAKVRYGLNQTTGWLPWKPLRAGKAIIWWPLEVGEAVTVISPGDLTLGEILPSSYSDAHSAPSDDPDLCIVQFGDGSEIRHNRSSGEYSAVYTGNASITVHQSLNLTAKSDVSIQSDSKKISLNGGKGVVTGDHICAYTGTPHSDCSSVVTAAK